MFDDYVECEDVCMIGIEGGSGRSVVLCCIALMEKRKR